MIIFVLVALMALAAGVELPPPCPTDVCDVFNEGNVFDLCISKLPTRLTNRLQKKCNHALDDPLKLEIFEEKLQRICHAQFCENVTLEVPPCDDPERQIGDKIRERESSWLQENFLELFPNIWTKDLVTYTPLVSRSLNFTEYIALAKYIVDTNFIDFEFEEVEIFDFPCGEEVDRIDTVTRWTSSDGRQRRAFSKYRLEEGEWRIFFEVITLIEEDVVDIDSILEG